MKYPQNIVASSNTTPMHFPSPHQRLLGKHFDSITFILTQIKGIETPGQQKEDINRSAASLPTRVICVSKSDNFNSSTVRRNSESKIIFYVG
mmetsp:Transcript_659/g.920  ORF Transcript_659/g.920 Transcript_659/m.920 type:complete len:92 (+) Transcript_659:1364-1639(+)